MNAELLFPSNYIKCADLMGKKVTKTIKKVAIDTLTRQGGAKEKKPVIWFSDTEKMLVMNKTNCKAIISLYGKETNDWVGKKITLKPAKDRFGAEVVDCVRIDTSVKEENLPDPEVEKAFDAQYNEPPQDNDK